MRTGAISTVQTHRLPSLAAYTYKCRPLVLGWALTVVYCALILVRGWFLLSGGDLLFEQNVPPAMADSQGTAYYATGGRKKGLEQGSGVSDGWSIFLDKRFHKVDDFCVRMGHNASPICSRLATGQLCCNCHWESRLNDAEWNEKRQKLAGELPASLI